MDIKGTSYDQDRTETYHVEKYIVPGVYAISFLFLLPYYTLFSKDIVIDTKDLASLVFIGLAVGHLIDALKMYSWGTKVKHNAQLFDKGVAAVLKSWGIRNNDIKEDRVKAQRILFTLLDSGKRTELAWNLVRWQKLIILGILSAIAGLEWIVFAFLAYTEYSKANPFITSFELHLFKAGYPWYCSAVTEFVFGIIMFFIAYRIYKYGLTKQERTNDSYLELLINKKDGILNILNKTSQILPPSKEVGN